MEGNERQAAALLGGFLSIRHADGVAYLDYLADFALLSPQKIEFGKNLLDQKRIIKGADVATVVIPLGAKLKDAEGKDTDKRLTIESVNGGADFIEDASAISQYGTIVKTVIFDDVTIAENLKAKGQAYLSSVVTLPESIELTAADLATVSTAFSSFHLGTYVDVVSKPHGLNQKFLVRKLSINLLDPAANKLTLGGVFEGLAASLKGLTDTQGKILNEISESVRKASEAVYNVEQNLESSIRQSEENIKATVAESYYLKDETDALVSSVSTTIEQTKESVEIRFDQFNADLEAVANGTDAEFEEIRKYIRFVDGSILLGQVGNELELKISNDRISFLQDDTEVAYFSDNKLYVTDGHFINALQIGDFAFIPRANGNLSFKRLDARNNGSIVGYATIDATKVM